MVKKSPTKFGRIGSWCSWRSSAGKVISTWI